MWYSPQHNCVVYQVPEPMQVAGAIHGARCLSPQLVAIPATLFAMQLARVLGLPVPPILDLLGYDWPTVPGRTPFAHQRHMAAFHALHPKSLNLSEMGVGKTYGLLAAADFLMRHGVIKKALIVSPLSTLRSVWHDEITRNFLGKRTATIVYGDRQKRIDRLADDVDFYIVNHDGLGIGTRAAGGGKPMALGPIAETVRTRDDIGLVIVDEASAYKDSTTLRTRILRQVLAAKPYAWLASGTPTPNSPVDAWSLARLVGNESVGTLTSFKGRVMQQVSTFKWLPRANSTEVVRKALTPAVRFSRAECIDLPECTVQTRDVELSPIQAAAYKELKKNLAVVFGNGKRVDAINEAALRTKLLQISCGAVYGPDREINRTDAGPRLEVLKEVIDEANAKVIVFCPFTSVVDLVYSELKATYGEKRVARVYGPTPPSARADIFRAFETLPEPSFIVADPGTMSHGITLVAADTIVWYGPTDRLETFDQANARIHRPGQVNKTLIVRLVSTPPEREIFKRLHEKTSLQGAVLKMVEEDR